MPKKCRNKLSKNKKKKMLEEMDTKSEDQSKTNAYKCRMQQCSVVVVWCTKQMTK